MAETMPGNEGSGSKVIRCSGYRWTDVVARAYKDEEGSFRDVARHTLVGPSEDAPFHLRYFELEPGGYTSYEQHAHRHVVVTIRGRGEVLLGDDRHEPLEFGDVVYVAPEDPHQFRAVGDEPFGFLCIVAADRDRPRLYRRQSAPNATTT